MKHLGLELDIKNKDSTYVATGMNGLTSMNFNPEKSILRPIATVGGTYQLADGQVVNLNGSYRKESFDATHTLSMMMTYAMCF
jgi:hypothetical protein